MKKVLTYIIAIIISLTTYASYAFDTALLDMRHKIFSESREIKPIIAGSTDSVLLSSMWDTCIIVMTQLDAYFSMLGIFNTIKDDDLTDEAFDYLYFWLDRIKDINELNISSIYNVKDVSDPETRVHMNNLISYFTQLNALVDNEVKKIDAIKRSLKLKGKR